jgi:hypothetical protein
MHGANTGGRFFRTPPTLPALLRRLRHYRLKNGSSAPVNYFVIAIGTEHQEDNAV